MVERGRIDLTRDSLFFSPYYHLQQGDVVLVEANKRKIQQQQQQYTLQQIGVVTTIVTAVALVLNFIK